MVLLRATTATTRVHYTTTRPLTSTITVPRWWRPWVGQPPLTSGRWRVEEGGGGGPSPGIDRGGRDPVTPAETGDGGESTCWFHNWALGPDGSLLGDSWVKFWGESLGWGMKGPGYAGSGVCWVSKDWVFDGKGLSC